METLYRKYRPKKFSEIVGQKHVKTLFINSIKNNNVSHAYIFAGPRGTGKTTIARILSKSLNCENRKDAEPCNVCNSCISIDKGNFMDVLEIDAASNRGIDEIRKIRETVGYHTAQGKYKVYIIDEAHMLTREAFNALLKTLEEPPSNVVFILATTNPEKIPQTIISRCQVIDFKNIPLKDIVDRLEFVCQKEKFNATKDALIEIAKRAKGGLRDALTILEQVAKSSKNNIDINDVRNTLGLVSEELIDNLLKNIKEGNIINILKIIDEVYYSGRDFETFLFQTIEKILLLIEENNNTEFINLLKPLSDILKDIKYSEEKIILVKLGFLNLINFKENNNKTTNKVLENIKKESEKIEENIESEKTEVMEKDIPKFDEVLEDLKINGDLSLYIGLSFAKIQEGSDKIKLIFPYSKKLHFELIKDKKSFLEQYIKRKFGITKEIEVILSNSTEDETLKKLSFLFGKNYKIEGD
ncbi:DNA polymerase III subunits gamma and tau [Thermosipho sp. 1063]|uniref:DNA polymerase III subunit gamma/tau n=1 Tax=unclassified Thermosipho (in: thermotogales) TaxID=2676525 RepID=UPI00094947A1|nr:MULTISPECIES: DNA polymerase III subunit gamma/tau [unclassified Thermosipho (in: thermotogales)]ANQ54303.1 DNA polymerase III subunit gamma/tau [Thermosipho sp. 1070]APT72748.1 DNA polymerase III subunits gamma and tau [Thermosipho sp. 1063]